MTLGQRIQELRRGSGLSQEGLGEKLGVSRQSISKWESDVAIPEVDKLIAASRLFDVSVGFLLGVEEPKAAQSEPEKTQDLSERELALVETIVNRYLEQRDQVQPEPEERPRRWRWIVIVAGLAVLLVISWSTISRLNDRIDRLTNQTQTVQNQVIGVENTVSSQIDSLTDRLEKLLEAQNHLLSEWNCELIDYIPAQKGVFALSARPKEYVPGMTAVFCAENSDGEQVTVSAEWDGVAFAARMDVPLWDMPKFSIELNDGKSRKTQPMETDRVYMLKSHFGMTVPAAGSGMGQSRLSRDGELVLDMEVDFELEAHTPGDFNREMLSPRRLTLVMRYGDRELLRRELDVEQWVAMEGAGRWRVDVSGTYSVQGEDMLAVDVLVTDNFGQQSTWGIVSKNMKYE